MHQGGVKVRSGEEKCPKTPHLTLIKALKDSIGCEEGLRREQIGKKKSAKAKAEPRDQAPYVIFYEKDNREERGMHEVDAEQLELSPPIDNREPTPTRAEERREHMMEAEGSSNATLIAML